MAKIPFRPLNGLLLLDKSPDISSNKALQEARFSYRAKKAGHTGTLDPFATGLLPVCFGEANKYARWLFDAAKTYQFQAVLGQSSTTGDTEGEISVIDKAPKIDDAQLRRVERDFSGEISQIPPKYSAIKVNGQRAYELARQGHDVDIPIRQVTIHELQLSVSGNLLTGTTCVSKGTYIRTLVEDIAISLGTVAYCRQLRRLQIANLVDDDNGRSMHRLDDIRALSDEAARDRLLLPMDLLCQQFPAQTISHGHWQNLILGRQVTLSDADISTEAGIIRLYLDGEFCGLGQIDGQRLKAYRLLNTGF